MGMQGVHRRHWAGLAGVTAFGIFLAISRGGPTQGQLNREDLRPGLVATYRDGAGRDVVQLDSAMALALKAGESANPRLDAGDGTVTWEGFLNVFRPSEYTFSVLLHGSFTLTIDGKVVLNAEAKDAATLKEG